MAAKAAAEPPREGVPDEEGIDASFHTPAWHAARLAAISDTPRLTLDELKASQAEDNEKLHALAATREAADEEYKRAMDKERQRRLGIADDSKPRDKKRKKHKEKEKHKKDKKKSKEGKSKKRARKDSE